MNRRQILAALAGGIAFAAAPALAQGYPERLVTVIVPFPAGGSSDTTARTVAAGLEKELGQTVIVENQPGANGRVGATRVANMPADGYTLLVGSIGVYAINKALFADALEYDPLGFDLLTVAVRTPNVLVASPDFPAATPEELVAYLKEHPDEVTFATSGVGSSDHLTAELFWQKSGTSGIHVPYQGGGPAITDLLGGNADVSFQNFGAVSEHLGKGTLKLIAPTSEARLKEYPDVPTLDEAGYPDLVVYSWQAVAAPKGLPAEVKEKLSVALRTVMQDPAVKEKFAGLGFEVVGNSPAEFETFLKGEIARWTEVVQAGGIKPQQ
jgi:tripartite-type tricarboxylate transporter receptor subunit TctC